MSKSKTPFDQAADTFVDAFKTSVRLQEETAKKCFELVKGWGESDDWTKNWQQLVEQAMPNMQKRMEESLKMWESNAQRCMELLGEGFKTTQTSSGSEAQAHLQSLWEKTLGAMRENTEAVIKLNSDAMQAYADYMKDLAPTEAAAS